MSIIDLKDLKNQKVKSVRVEDTIPLEECNANDEDVLFLDTPVIEGHIRYDREKLLFEGKVETTLSIPCSKCLEEISFPVNKPFEVVLVTEDEEYFMDYDSYCYKKDRIHLWDLIRTQIWDEVPIRILCREECKGICNRCGHNLNKEDCGCLPEEKPIDERMAKLRELLD